MPFLVDVEATIAVPDVYAAPTINFSYPGSSDLRQLWSDLAAIGWEVPERPLVPYQASSWTGAGRKERGHAYRVEDFIISAAHWDLEVVADRGLETINLLRRYGVDVHMPITYLDFLRKTQLNQRSSGPVATPSAAALSSVVSQAAISIASAAEPLPIRGQANTDTVTSTLVADSVTDAIVEHSDNLQDGEVPTPHLSVVRDPEPDSTPSAEQAPVIDPNAVPIPNVILLSTKAWSVLETEPGLEIYRSVVVPGRTKWVWSETATLAEELGSTLPDPRILFETVELGWKRSNDEIPAFRMDPNTERPLWFVVSQLNEANNLASFLQGHPEVSTRIVQMNPLPRTTAFDDCFLVGAVVPSAVFAKIGSKVVANYPDVIARGKPAPVASIEEPVRR